MAVYLVYRSAYETPLGRRIFRFEDTSLLDWFQRHWSFPGAFPDERDQWHVHAQAKAEKIGLKNVYGFGALFELMAERGHPPQSARALQSWLHHKPYPEGAVYATEHAIQMPTDDDELDLAILMFDDEFAKKHPDRVQYLLHDRLELPTQVRSDSDNFVWRGSAKDLKLNRHGSGATYAILLVIEDTGWLTELLGVFRFKGVRLPDWVESLKAHARSGAAELVDATDDEDEWPNPLIELRKLVLEQDCVTMRQLLEAYEKAQQQAFDVEDQTTKTWQRHRHPSLIQTSQHFAQIAFRDTFTLCFDAQKLHDINLQWYFFDDLWAASYPDLAKSLLRYANEQLPLFEEA